MDAFFSPSPIGALMASGLAGGIAIARFRFKIDYAAITVVIMALWAISTSIAALVRFDGSYVQWAGMGIILLGISLWTYLLPSEEQ